MFSTPQRRIADCVFRGTRETVGVNHQKWPTGHEVNDKQSR
jgi:hypothetical protein